jgi:hypothetical protein
MSEHCSIIRLLAHLILWLLDEISPQTGIMQVHPLADISSFVSKKLALFSMARL